MKELFRIIIPGYPDKVLIAKSRAKVYFVNKPNLRGKRKLPKKYKDRKKYAWSDEGKLLNLQTGDKVVANSKSAGTMRYWVVNLQDIWNGKMAAQSRAQKVNILKDILRPSIQAAPILEEYPLGLCIKLFNTQFNVDASNKGSVYTKVIEDLLVTEGKIVDDGPSYINDTGRIILTIVDKPEDIRMEIIIFKSI